MYSKQVHKYVWDLAEVLQGACHATGCPSWRSCPQECVCLKHRKFKLQDRSATLWEIGRVLTNTHTLKELRELGESVVLIWQISAYHGAQTWEDLFMHIRMYIREITRKHQPHTMVFHMKHIKNCLRYTRTDWGRRYPRK